MSKKLPASTVRCLIVERHDWETGGSEQQLQFPKAAFQGFFARGGNIQLSIFDPRGAAVPTRMGTALVSAYTTPSGTYRLNQVPEIGGLPACFVFIQEVEGRPRTYELWWNPNATDVVTRFSPMRRARASQHGPGRQWKIVTGPIARTDPN